MIDRSQKTIIVVLALISTVAFVLMTYRLARAPQEAARAAVAKKEKQIDLGAVVTQVRTLSRLETAAMRVVHVSTIEQSYGVIPKSLAGDKLTFFAVGDVIAGIDLSAVRREDVRLEPDGVIVLRLPEPQILVSRIDNDQSKIINRSVGAFRRGDPHLESRIRAHAERGVREEALKKGILDLAGRSAEEKLAGFLRQLGVSQVRFEQGGRGTGERGRQGV